MARRARVQGQTLRFIGAVVRSARAWRTLPGGRRRRQLLEQMRFVGPGSWRIVTLVSGLVGLILAYLGAAQLERFGAVQLIADLVTLGSVREVAALMTGVILAGRIGAAYAAQLGSMQANEEIDALRVLGLDPMAQLVLPRLLAVALMAPMLTAWAAGVAVLAGGLAASVVFAVPLEQFMVRAADGVRASAVAVGLLKGTVYAVLVAAAGCLQGLRASRDARGVGLAATQAVVQGLVWIVVAASVLTVLFQRLGV